MDGDLVLFSHDGAGVCSRECAESFDLFREQQEITPEWSARLVQEVTVESAGCTIPKVTLNTKDKPAVVQVTVNMPAGVSSDALKDFTGEIVGVSYSRTELVPVPEA